MDKNLELEHIRSSCTSRSDQEHIGLCMLQNFSSPSLIYNLQEKNSDIAQLVERLCSEEGEGSTPSVPIHLFVSSNCNSNCFANANAMLFNKQIPQLPFNFTNLLLQISHALLQSRNLLHSSSLPSPFNHILY